jgi:purine-binding chemotaxis protein CheW
MQSIRDFFCFKVDQYKFALPLSQVERVIQAVEIQKVPDAIPLIQGLIDYHGTVIPVLNFRYRLGLGLQEIHVDHYLLLATTTRRQFFIVVNEVLGVSETVEKTFMTETADMDYELGASGIFRRKDGIFFIYDLEKFIKSDDHILLDKLLTEKLEMDEND